MNKYTLSFYDKEIEKNFLRDSIIQERPIFRTGILVGIIIFFVTSKTLFVYEEWHNINWLKFSFIPFVGLFSYLFTYSKAYEKYYLHYITFVITLIGLFSVIDGGDKVFLYVRVVFLTLIPFITFPLIILANGIIFTSYVLYNTISHSLENDIIKAHSLELLAFILISLLVFYIKQRYQRLNYFKLLEINKKNKQLENDGVIGQILKDSNNPDLDLIDFLNQSLSTILSLSWLDILSKGSIFITNDEGNLEMVVSKDLGELTKMCAIVKPGQCLCGMALQQKKMIFENCVTDNHTIKPDNISPHVHFNIPLVLNDEVLGVLNIYVKHGHQKTESEEQFFNLISGVLASVIYRHKTEQERKATNRQLKRYFTAIEQSETAILFTDTKANITYSNPYIYNLTGYKPKEIIGKNVSLFSTEKTSKNIFDDLWNTIRQKKTWKGEFINKKKDGTEYYEKAIISPILNENGETVEYITIKEDITEDKRKTTKIIQQKGEIERIHNKIRDSIDYSRRIQESLLASNYNLSDSFKNVMIKFLPKETVSGDFYLTRKKKHKIYIAVADCTGHGVPGALVSALGLEELSHIINTKNLSVAQILDVLNYRVNKLLNNDNEIGSDGMDISLVCIDTEHKTIEYAGARGIIYIYKDNNLVPLKTDRISIGMQMGNTKDFAFNLNKITYTQGETLFMLTDGLTDQISPLTHKRVGSKNIKQLLKNMASVPYEQANNTLEQFIQKHVSEEQTDDITLITLTL